MKKKKANILRPHAEDQFADELKALKANDQDEQPINWSLSPKSVVTYLMGGTLSDGTVITPKYFGDQRLIEVAVATLLTDRALLLMGIPGTAKTWVSEHLTAAISGDSKLLVQGTTGLSEDALRYGWNYAKLLAKGPSKDALVASPMLNGMKTGKLVRIEELTRIPSEIQDTLITILSEKVLPIPELSTEIQALQGFNVIATANDRDRGVNDLSSALQRRFNVVQMPLPDTVDKELAIVKNRIQQYQSTYQLPKVETPEEEILRIITIFRELREGKTLDGQSKVKTPSGTLSTAEIISVINQAQVLSGHFGDKVVHAGDYAAGVAAAVVKDPVKDQVVWKEYLETVVKERQDWEDIYKAFQGKKYRK